MAIKTLSGFLYQQTRTIHQDTASKMHYRLYPTHPQFTPLLQLNSKFERTVDQARRSHPILSTLFSGRSFTPYPLAQGTLDSHPQGPKSQALKLLDRNQIGAGLQVLSYPQYELSANLSLALSTSGIYQCAGLVIINPDKPCHYLSHISHVTSKQDLVNHFKNIESQLDITNAQIFILPGSDQHTDCTVGQIMEALDEVSPGKPEAVQFVHLPNQHSTHIDLVSYQGDVWTYAREKFALKRIPLGGKPIAIDGRYRPAWFNHAYSESNERFA